MYCSKCIPFRVYSHLFFCDRDVYNPTCLCCRPTFSGCIKILNIIRNKIIFDAHEFSAFSGRYLTDSIFSDSCFSLCSTETFGGSFQLCKLNLSIFGRILMNWIDKQIYPAFCLPIKGGGELFPKSEGHGMQDFYSVAVLCHRLINIILEILTMFFSLMCLILIENHFVSNNLIFLNWWL